MVCLDGDGNGRIYCCAVAKLTFTVTPPGVDRAIIWLLPSREM